MRLCHRFIISVVVILWSLIASPAMSAPSSPTDANVTKLEIKKFRFGGHRRKRYERLVVEFVRKEAGKNKPTLKVVPNGSGKEATLFIDQAVLVGAIPEALINESYVSKSKYLGPVSINTEGGGTGFSVRTFLKDAVTVEAFLLEHPSRLVLDVAPMDVTRSENDFADREIASEDKPAKRGRANRIVCYPSSQQVIATVDFHPQSGEPKAVELNVAKLAKLEEMLVSNSARKSVETAICFPANSQLSPNISYQPKLQDTPTYVQQEPTFVGGQKNGGLFSQSMPSFAPAMGAPVGGGMAAPSLLGAAPRGLAAPAAPPSGLPPAPPKPKPQLLSPGSLMPPLK